MSTWVKTRPAAWAIAGLIAVLAFSIHSSVGQPTANAQTLGQPPADHGVGGSLQIVSTVLAGGTQQIVVTDTKSSVMAVYHIEPANGKLQLRSVRNLVWDLRLEEFNGQSPLPSELRAVQP